ncbi:MAG: hypothetical protein O3B31_05980 [Chloroflexi bacterium]|nr:hypothetical protein [Chloroflexota bacterium]MDA1002882.1 hypothetical protein [Chloroflexota bacterium]
MATDVIVDVLTPFIGLIGVGFGFIGSWWLTERSQSRLRKQQSENEVRTASSICLGRIFKMQTALTANAPAIFTNEQYLLGGDTDRFLLAVSSRPSFLRDEYGVFQKMTGVLFAQPTPLLSSTMTALAGELSRLAGSD